MGAGTFRLFALIPIVSTTSAATQIKTSAATQTRLLILEVSFICVTLCTPWIGHPQYIQVWDLLLISFPHSGQLINATLLHSFLHGIFTFENIHIIHDSCPKDNYIHTKINQYDTCDRYTIRGLECGCGGLWTKIKRASSTSGHDAATACTAHGCDEVCSFLL